MQKDNKWFDDMAKLASGAAGGVIELKRELDRMVAAQMEKFLSNMQWVKRDEFNAVKEMAAKARAEQERLEKRLEALEARAANSEKK